MSRPRPSGPPTVSTLEMQADFNQLVDESLTATRQSAEKWRTGAAALVTLLTAALVIKGPENASQLTFFWRMFLTLSIGGGLALMVWALWSSLRAAAGSPAEVTLPGLERQYGSVKGYRVAQARMAANDLRNARRKMVIAIPLFLAGLLGWWWADTAKPTPVVAATVGGTATCGELESGDDGRLIVKVKGTSVPVNIPYGDLENLVVLDVCP